MPYVPDSRIKAVDPDLVVWRFMSLEKYLAIFTLKKPAIWFPRADKMEDNWEGLRGQGNELEAADMDSEERWSHDTKATIWKLYDDFRLGFYLSCWHLSPHDSAGMWKLYASENAGVAIRTTWGALTASIATPGSIIGGAVKYVDLATTAIPYSNMYKAFLHKRLSFEHEKEVRLLYQNVSSEVGDGNYRLDPPRKTPPGISVPLDLDALTPTVYVSPRADPWLVDVVKATTAKYKLDWSVEKSNLYDLH